MSSIVGRVFDGRYVISQLLGRGGMGVVYLAKQLDPPRDVVIKMITPSLRDDPQSMTRFEREARRLQELQHPNIVRFYGYGYEREHGASYLVMEYVDGDVLSDVLRGKGRFRFEEFVPIASQILKSVGHVHSRNVLIRDIKPSNVMLCERQGRSNFVKLLDFGLAKLREGETQITSGFVLGTAGYIAPEVLRGEEVDLRSDVYALGVMFYLLLAGKLPFNGKEQAALFSQTLRDSPPPLGTHLGEQAVPPAFLELVHRCLEKDPDRRPSDANAVIEEMIDAVPASLFRLPRASRSVSGGTPVPWVGNSGTSEPMPSAEGMHGPPPTLPSGPALTGSIAVPPAPVTRRSGRGALVAVAAMAALVGGSAAVVLAPWRSGDQVGELGALPAPGDSPDVHGAVSSRLRDAERAAARGDTAEAMEAYLDVLELDPDHTLARTGLQRVREMPSRAEADGGAEPVVPADEPEASAVTLSDHSSDTPTSRRTRVHHRKRPSRAASSRPSPTAVASPSAPATAAIIDARPRSQTPPPKAMGLLSSPQKGRTDALLPLN